MFSPLFPAGIAVVGTEGDLVTRLFPEEERAIEGALESRRREFMTGRSCARSALSRLGQRAQPLPVRHNGEPRWPPGIVGSISHCDGYRVAAVGFAQAFASIGVDVEQNGPLPAGVLEAIASPEEREWVRRSLDREAGICWDRLLFSIKEAVYKAFLPDAMQTLSFHDGAVEIDPRCRGFSFRLNSTDIQAWGVRGSAVKGRWLCNHGFIGAAVVTPAA